MTGTDPGHQPGPQPSHLPPDGAPRPGRALRYLPALTLAAVVTVTSTSEWTLARTVLDLPPAVAWAWAHTANCRGSACTGNCG